MKKLAVTIIFLFMSVQLFAPQNSTISLKDQTKTFLHSDMPYASKPDYTSQQVQEPKAIMPQQEEESDVILIHHEYPYIDAIEANLVDLEKPSLVLYSGDTLYYVNMSTGEKFFQENISDSIIKEKYLVSGNFDADNLDEIALLVNTTVYFYDGDGTSLGSCNLADHNVRIIKTSDLDGDGYNDIIVLYDYMETSNSSMYIIDGQTKTLTQRIPTFGTFEITEHISLIDVSFGDFNFDGSNDIFCLFYNASAYPYQEYIVRVYDGVTFNSLANKHIHYAYPSGAFLAGDYNGDDYCDINVILGTRVLFLSGNNLSVLANVSLTEYETRFRPISYVIDNDNNGLPEVYTIMSDKATHYDVLFRTYLDSTSPDNLSYDAFSIPGVDYFEYWVLINATRFPEKDAVLFYSPAIITYSFSSSQIVKETRVSGAPSFFFEYDYNLDGQPDIFALDLDVMIIIISDTEKPNLVSYDINPVNATIRDSIYISIKVKDRSGLFEPKLKCFNVFTKDIIAKDFISIGYISGYHLFMIFLVGMPEGEYKLNIIITDFYGNIFDYNETHPDEPLIIRVYSLSYLYLDITNGTSVSVYGLEKLNIDNDSYDEFILFASNSTHTLIKLFDTENNEIVLLDSIVTKSFTISEIITKPIDLNNDGFDDLGAVIYTGAGDYEYLSIIIESNKLKTISNEKLPLTVKNVYTFEYVNWGASNSPIPIFGTDIGTIFLNGTILFDHGAYGLISKNIVSGSVQDLLILFYNDTATYISLMKGADHTVQYIKRLVNDSIFDIKHEIYALGNFTAENKETLAVMQLDKDLSQLIITIVNYTNGDILRTKYTEFIDTGELQTIAGDFNNDNLSEIFVSNLNFGFVIFNSTLDAVEAVLYLYMGSTSASFWSDWNGDGQRDFVLVEGTVGGLTGDISATVYSIDGRTGELSSYEFRNQIEHAKMGKVLIEDAGSEQLVGTIFDTSRNTYFLTVLWDLDNFYQVKLLVEANEMMITQGDAAEFMVSVFNPFDSEVADGMMYLHAYYYGEEHTYTFTNLLNGSYYLEVSTVKWPLGIVNYTIEFKHDYYRDVIYDYELLVVGSLNAKIENPANATQGQDVWLEILVFDGNYNPIGDSELSAYFMSQKLDVTHVMGNYYIATIHTEGLPIGRYAVNITVSHDFANPYSTVTYFELTGIPRLTIYGPGINTTGVMQGDSPTISLTLKDIYGNPVDDASISAFFAGSSYMFAPQGSGNYTVILSTTGVQAGVVPCFISLRHPILEPTDFVVNITIIGRINLRIQTDENPLQNTYMEVIIEAKDLFGYPISELDMTVALGDRIFKATEIPNEPGRYSAEVSLYGVRHGYYNLTVSANGEYYSEGLAIQQIYVDVQIPKLEIGWDTLLTLILISLALSFVGLIIYFKVTQHIKHKRESEEEFERSLKMLDKIYLIALAGFGITVGLAFNYAMRNTYDLATALIGLALVEILLLSAIWIFRDTNETLFIERFNTKRFLLGLWHVVMVPILIFLIFDFGVHIEWFEVHVVGDYINIGGIAVPKLFLSLLGTYIGSYAVIVINTYKEARRLMLRIGEMRDQGTPQEVLMQEKELNIGRLSNSIRIKFLVFLVVLGAAIVSSTKLLQFYQVGVIVIIPLIVIVVIPYIVAKMLNLLNIAARKIR